MVFKSGEILQASIQGSDGFPDALSVKFVEYLEEPEFFEDKRFDCLVEAEGVHIHADSKVLGKLH